MLDFVYQMLAGIGYLHPIHPPVTHLPVGMTMGALIFACAALALQRQSLETSARHCTVLAFIGLFPTVLMGYMDWQHSYRGAWLFPIKVKLILAGVLLVLLAMGINLGRQSKGGPLRTLAVYGLSFVTVVALGYFGGELVYGTRTPPPPATLQSDLSQEGEIIFSENCAGCHHVQTTETKIGPGLKGIFKLRKLPVSGRPVTEANIRLQMKTPYDRMPSFAQMPEEKIDALIAYMKDL